MKMLKRISPTLCVFLLALIAYGFSSQVTLHPTSIAPHYVYLAQSLLHGHVDLIQLPPTTYDLLQYNGRWFVAGSPMPAILMLPFVAIFGVNFSDVLFSVVLGAINVALVYTLLGSFKNYGDTEVTEGLENLRGLRASVVISESTRRWLTLLFALGTPHWYLASLGSYWFAAHIVATFFALLAVREVLTKQRWFLSGLWLACAGFARPTVLALIPFFLIVVYVVIRNTQCAPHSPWSILRKTLLFASAICLGLSAHAVYNYARFHSFSDFGYSYVAGAQNITSVYARYGGFNPRFLPCNLSIALITPPEVNGQVPGYVTEACSYLLEGVNLSDTSAPIAPNPMGMSLFLTTPALLLIFAARRREPIVVAAWIGLLATMIPLWLYHNTGSLQFGYRYIFDATPLWLILLAGGIGEKITWPKRGLILASIAINLWGFLWMFEKFVGAHWGF